jgi:uncharacterized SAM-binding protein YcdF (DUF218 family)
MNDSSTSERKGRARRKSFVRAGVFAMLAFGIIFVVLAPELLLDWTREFLIVRDAPRRSDFVFLLGGDYELRAPAAAALIGAGWAPRVVLALERSPNFTDTTTSILKAHGVPGEDVVELRPNPPVSDTADECSALRNYLARHPVHRILVVTSAIHTRRARMMINRALHGMNIEILMSPAEAPELEQPSNSEVEQEAGKLIYHFFVP